MSDPRPLLFQSWHDNLAAAERLVSDVPPGRITEQPGGLANHPAWTLGHLTHYHAAILAVVRGEAVEDPASREGADRFDEGSQPSPEPSVYPSKAELVDQFRRGHEAIDTALREAPPERLAERPGLERWAQAFGETGHLLVYLMGTHEAFHLGELAPWRHAAGLRQPPV